RASCGTVAAPSRESDSITERIEALTPSSPWSAAAASRSRWKSCRIVPIRTETSLRGAAIDTYGVILTPRVSRTRLAQGDEASHFLPAEDPVRVLVEQGEVVAELRVAEHLAEGQHAVAVGVERAEGVGIGGGLARRGERVVREGARGCAQRGAKDEEADHGVSFFVQAP